MRAGWAALAALAAATLALPSLAKEGPAVQVDFSNPGLSPQRWTLIIYPDGNGHFHSERGTAPVASLKAIEAPDVDRDIRLSAPFAERVFQAARNHKWFSGECESHLKVAFQGWKRLSYAGPEGQGSCQFNYSRDKEIQSLGDSLVAVAGAVVEGARLETLLAHDPLGLDSELEYVTEAVGNGQMQQICVIRGILERLVEDESVMERVRKRARILLAKADE
ncbi:MAG: hypothetical protein ABSE51_03470 [Terracidiphilus sp.]|jgi:hypothetical protein